MGCVDVGISLPDHGAAACDSPSASAGDKGDHEGADAVAGHWHELVLVHEVVSNGDASSYYLLGSTTISQFNVNPPIAGACAWCSAVCAYRLRHIHRVIPRFE